MASKEELSEQLAITTKLNTVISQMAGTLSRIESSYENQITQIEKIKTAINQLDTERVVQEINGLTDKVGDLVKSLTAVGEEAGKSMQKVVEEASKAGRSATSLTGKMKVAASSVSGVGKAAPDVNGVKDVFNASMEAAQQFIGSNKKLEKLLGGRLPDATLITVAAISGLAQGIKNVVAMTKSIGGFVSTFVSGLTSIAASIIAIPFKLFTGLVDMAANASHGSNELLKAIEDLRKAFGDLRGPTNKTITGLSTSLKGFHDTGLSTFRVFGYLHERLNMLRELVEELGGTFHLVEQELKDNGGAILAYQKGLGIANEEMGEIILRARGMGVETKDVLNSMTKQTLSMGKAFGISQKVIGKDMAKAMKNVAKFGGLAVKEIAQASVYARKLGLELEKITGALDYDNFEDASDAVSQLSQRFGTTIDTFKLLEEENPAKRIDMVKKALQAAGHDAATFNRHDLKLVASLAKVDEAAAKAAFSVSNQGVAMQDVQKESENAEAQQLSQAEALQKLAASIERLVKTGGGQTGGFWDMFVKGLMSGLQYSKEFRTIIWNIKKGLYAVFRIGFQLGRMLPKIIPDLGKTLGGIKEFFDPKKFSKLFGGISQIVRDFFAEGGSDKGNVPRLLEKLKEKFEDFFTSQGPAAKKIIEGFKGMMKLISNTVADIIPVVAEHITKAIKFVTALITGKKKLTGAQGAAEGGLGFLADLITPIWDALKAAWPMLWNAIKELWAAAWPHIKKGLFAIAWKAGPWIAATLFGPALMKAALVTLTTSLTSAALGAIGKVFNRGGAAEKGLEGAVNKLSQKIGEMGKKGGSPGEAVQQAGKTAAASQKVESQVGKVNWRALGAKLVTMFAALTMGLAAFWVVLQMTKDKSREEIINAGIAMGVALTTAASAAGIAAIVQKALAKPNWKALAVGLIAVGATTVALGGVVWLMMKMLGKFSPTKMLAVGKVMLQMSLVFLAMVPLLAAAAAVGALIIGTKGTIIIAAGAGMIAIGAAVGKVADTTADVIKMVSTLNIGPDFQVKIDAFLGIMKSLQAFADTLVSMIKLMTPSFTEFITGTGEKFSTKIKAATKLLDKMIGDKTSQTGIIGIMYTVLDVTKQLGVDSEKMGPAAEILGGTLTAITSLMKTVTPSDAFYEAGSGFLQQLGSHKPFTDLATDTAYYMNQMREGMMVMLTGSKDGAGSKGLLAVMQSAADVDIPDPEKAKLVVQLLDSMAKILEHIVPDAETVKAFQTTQTTEAAWGLIKESTSHIDASAIASTINTMGEQMQKMIPALGSVMGSVIEKAGKLNANQLKSVAVVGDVLSAVANIVGAIAGSLVGRTEVLEGTAGGAFKKTVKLAPDLGKALGDVKDSIPGLVKAIIGVTKIKGLKEAQKGLKMVGAVFDILGKLPALVSAMSSGAGGKKIHANTIVGHIGKGGLLQELTSIFTRMLKDAGGHPLSDLLESLNEVGRLIQQHGGGSSVNKVGNDLAAVMKAAGGLVDSATKTSASGAKLIRKKGLKPAIDAVREIVKSVNDLNTALEKAPPLKLTAGLKKVAGAAGLGGRANYSIKNKGVNIKINMKVTMNADDLERAMVLRASSIIRDRINFAGNKPDDRYAALPDNPSSPVTNATSLGKGGD